MKGENEISYVRSEIKKRPTCMIVEREGFYFYKRDGASGERHVRERFVWVYPTPSDPSIPPSTREGDLRPWETDPGQSK